MAETQIYLQQICDQLKECMNLADCFNVAALIDDNNPHKVQGWLIVRLQPDGKIQPVNGKRYKSISELILYARADMTKIGTTDAKDCVNNHSSKSAPKRRRKNDRVQFEIHSNRDLMPEFQWCVDNLGLKEDRGLVYQVKEIYITTSSQRVIDKVNKHFGTAFTFKAKEWMNHRVFYIN